MEKDKIREWEQALETAENSPITMNLSKDAAPGDRFEETGTDGIHRVWLRVEVVAGNAGARWAYWAPADGQLRHRVIADRIFNGDAPHFVGMLMVPHIGPIPGAEFFQWVMISPKAEPPKEIKIVDRPEGVRYERSREIFDVETGQTRKI